MHRNREGVATRPNVIARHCDDGSILIDSAVMLPPPAGSLSGRIAHWARKTPAATYLSEGERRMTFAEAEAMRRHLARHLLALPLSAERPLMIMAANGIDHALFMLAATSVGIPVAVVSPAYAGATSIGSGKLSRVFAQVDPGIILIDDVAATGAAIAALGSDALIRPVGDRAWLDGVSAVPDEVAAAAEDAVGPDTVAKLLFTSGSTGTPKAVINTRRMMVSNMQALALTWPLLEQRPPVLVDWLPWSHTFGGNCCFNVALWFGGHFHVDHGRPTGDAIGRSVEAIRRHRPTIYFNVPIGYELLLPKLEEDTGFAADFFGNLDFLFSAGAPLPAGLRARLDAVGLSATGRRPVLAGGWGSTETAPFATALNFPTAHAGNLGTPIPGTTIKMVPDAGRYELRVRGPNVTPGYWRDDAASAAMFDEDGFYRIGDAGRFADPSDPSAGILFDGRVAENFKLSSGTFVNVGALRLAIIAAGEGLIADVVVAGEGRSELGLLLFPNETACRDLLDDDRCSALAGGPASRHPAIAEHLAASLRAYNTRASGSSMRAARFLIADEPPNAAQDEITEKGYLNQRRVLARRHALVDVLFDRGTML